jgi:hypothetical protein
MGNNFTTAIIPKATTRSFRKEKKRKIPAPYILKCSISTPKPIYSFL